MQPHIVPNKQDIEENREPEENPQEEHMLSALKAQPPREIAEPYVLPHISRKSASLSAAIRRQLAYEKNKTILFTSAYRREGSTMVAFQAARAAANQSAGRVLYVHISEHLPRFFRDIHVKIPLSLDDYINKEGGDVLPFVVLDKSGLVCAWFRGPGEGVSPENLKALISSLRKCFDFTVLGGDEMLNGGSSPVFSNLVDGTILVAEAERTRVPVAIRMKRAVEESGGKVIGAILNRRKYHIPRWLYRMLYGGGL